jgi:molecular chaperone Hsp33
MNDRVCSFLFEELDIRGALVQLGSAWQSLTRGRRYAPTTGRLLGEMTAVTALLGSQLKSPGRLSFQIQGHGAVRLMLVDCNEQMQLRGVAKAPEDLQVAPLPQLLGDGKLVLTLQDKSGAAPYQSVVPLEGDSIAAIFENHLRQSVQQPARLWLHCDETAACGLYLQKLPKADERDEDGWNRVQILAATLRPGDLLLPPQTLLTRLFPDETLRLFAPRAASHHCPRDEAKVLDMLRALGRKEVQAIVAEHGAVVIHDDICNHEYRFEADIITRLFPPPVRTLH